MGEDKSGQISNEEVFRYLTQLPPGSLGLAGRQDIKSVSRLELGEANLNFLVTTAERKYVLRLSMDPASESRSRTEFGILRALDSVGIAPKAFYLDESKTRFGVPLLIIEYIDGKPLSELERGVISPDSAEKLARLTARIHSLDAKTIMGGLPTRGSTYQSWVDRTREDIQYIRKNRESRSLEGEFDELLDDALGRLEVGVREASCPNVVTPGHGDIGAQNVIVESGSGNLRLIDWENFGLWDPAAEVAMVFEAFGLDFPHDQERRFLETYARTRADETLSERLDVFRPIVRFEQLTWGVKHVFEITNGEMNRAFVEATEMSKHLAFVDFCLNRCMKTGLVDIESDRLGDLRIFPPELG